MFAAIAAFGIGNAVQSYETSQAIEQAFGIPVVITALVLAALAAVVILGGIRSIGRFTAFFVPFMGIIYMLGGGFDRPPGHNQHSRRYRVGCLHCLYRNGGYRGGRRC